MLVASATSSLFCPPLRAVTMLPSSKAGDAGIDEAKLCEESYTVVNPL